MGSQSPPPPVPVKGEAHTPSPADGSFERVFIPPSMPPSPRPPPNIPPHSRSSSSSGDQDKPDLSAVGRVLGAGEEDHIPKLGKVRCYWSLLTSDLEFLYLDPVLQHHMGAQHHSMLGTSLFNYLHPEELEQARTDLKGIVESGTLFGSVTRVRFARLPRVREILGCQEPEFAADANMYIADDNYLALDLVLNAAGEGLILAFFHAIVDKDEAQDKDESKKSEWTNWCGTPFITTEMVKLLWAQVDSVPRAAPPPAPAFPPSRVFQVLMASPEHEVLLSHPPPRDPSADRSITPCDGGYWEEEFQKLLLEISLNPQGGSQFAEAKTTCTRRFRAKHTLLTEGCYRVIESVFIPYGTLIFACFQTINQQFLPRPAPSSGLSLPAPSYIDPALSNMHHRQQPQHQLPHSFPQAPHPGWPSNGAIPPPHHPHLAPPPQHPGPYPTWSTNPPPPTHNPYNSHHPAPSSSSGNYGPPPPHAYVHPPTAPRTDGYTDDRYESTSPTGSRSPGADSPPTMIKKRKSPDPLAPSVPLVRPKKSQRGGSGGGSLSASGVPKDPSQLRNGGKPPKGVKECQSCGLKDSPEWRKGESGQKDLCNACGLRYARLVAKQQGKIRSRKKKEKNGQPESDDEGSGSAPAADAAAPPPKKKAKKQSETPSASSTKTPTPSSKKKNASLPPPPVANGGPSSSRLSPPPGGPPSHHPHAPPPQMHSPPRHHGAHPSYSHSGPPGPLSYPPHPSQQQHHQQQPPYHHQQGPPPPVHPYYKNGNGSYPPPPHLQSPAQQHPHYLPPQHQQQPHPYGQSGGGYYPAAPPQHQYPSYSPDGPGHYAPVGGYPPPPPPAHYGNGGAYGYGGGVSVPRGYEGGEGERRD